MGAWEPADDRCCSSPCRDAGDFACTPATYYTRPPTLVDAGCLWLVPTDGNPDNIWWFSPTPTAQPNTWRGMAGATLQFPLVDGRVFHVKGPWCSNPTALFEDTGIDLR
jgi:hypothetical protein